MKKFLAMLVAAMMVLSLVAIPVLADGEVVFAVENAPATATPGTEITVNLTVNGTFEAHVLNMQFNYNADAFEYVSHTRGDVLNQIIDLGGTQLVDATTIPGSMRLGVMMPTAAFTQSGTICSVTLRVKEGAANGASDLALVITEFKNFPTGGQATPIANVVNNATVTITGGSEPTPVPPTEEPTPTQNPNTPAPGGEGLYRHSGLCAPHAGGDAPGAVHRGRSRRHGGGCGGGKQPLRRDPRHIEPVQPVRCRQLYPSGGRCAREPAEPHDRRRAPAHLALPRQGHLCSHPRCFGTAGAFVPQGVTLLRLYPV